MNVKNVYLFKQIIKVTLRKKIPSLLESCLCPLDLWVISGGLSTNSDKPKTASTRPSPPPLPSPGKLVGHCC